MTNTEDFKYFLQGVVSTGKKITTMKNELHGYDYESNFLFILISFLQEKNVEQQECLAFIPEFQVSWNGFSIQLM